MKTLEQFLVMYRESAFEERRLVAAGYDTLAAENAALRAELAFARSTGDESALEYHALKARLAEAEALLEIVAPLAYAQWKSGSCGSVEAVVGLNEPITGIADSADGVKG